jgi:ribonuclease HI
LVTSLKGKIFKYILQMHFPASNNAIEYEALLHGLRTATTLGIRQLRVLRDSLFIVN